MVILFAFLLGLVFPGLSSFLGGTFYDEGVIRGLPEDARKALASYEEQQALLNNQLEKLNHTIITMDPSKIDKDRLSNLIAIRAALQSELGKSKPPIESQGFYLNSLMFLWPAIYLSLGLLVFALPPHSIRRESAASNRITMVFAFLLLWVLHRCITWARNFLFFRVGRTVYSETNFDISRMSFFTQEIMALVVCLLIIILWFQWIELGAVRFATGIFTLPEAIALARPCESELLVGHGVGPDIAGRSR